MNIPKVSIGVVLQLCAIYLLSDIFHTLQFNSGTLTIIGIMGLWVFTMIEIRKWGEYFWKNRHN